MGKKLRRFGGIFVPFHNFKKLLGWSDLKQSYLNAGASAKDIFQPKHTQTVIKETYEEAVVRLNLSEEDQEKRKKTFFRMCLFYIGIALVLFIYAIYLMFTSFFIAVFIALMLVAVALSLAFREHFWYVQMTCRRLGLSIKDWANYTFGGKKK